MKKLSAFIFLLSTLFIISCTYEPKPDAPVGDSQNDAGKDGKATQVEDVVGKWKWVEWSNQEFTPEEKQQVMSHAVLEFTSDGKFITRVPGKENTSSDYVFDKNQNLLIITIAGKDERNDVVFKGNRMTLKSVDGTVVFERLAGQ